MWLQDHATLTNLRNVITLPYKAALHATQADQDRFEIYFCACTGRPKHFQNTLKMFIDTVMFR